MIARSIFKKYICNSNFGRKCIIQARSCVTVINWLESKGYKNDIAKLMIKAFTDGNLSPDMIKSMGPSTLKSLADAAQREFDSMLHRDLRASIKVNISTSESANGLLSFKAKVGDNLYTLCGLHPELKNYFPCTCEGNANCSTCHVIIQGEEYFSKVPPAEENEQDLLDVINNDTTPTSRLGCQIRLTEECDGIILKVPQHLTNLK